MSIYVRYKVPVLVEVDLVQERVMRVQVDDERAEGPVDVLDVEPGEISADDERRAVGIAESDAWPAWELGW